MRPRRSSVASVSKKRGLSGALELTRAEARALTLHAQGLSGDRPFGKGKGAALDAIKRLGYVQIDTISVVERAHHHVLWSRVPDYAPAHLHQLHADQEIFEYWSHAAAYLPMRDFRFSLPRKKQFADGKRHWFRRNRRVQAYVLDRITAEGPLQAKDFEHPRKAGSWFDWKPAKIALEQLAMQGTFMVRERKGFQKIYDLTERVLPPGVDARFPELPEQARHLIQSTLRAHGFASAREISYLRKNPRLAKAVERALKELLEEKEIQPIRVEDLEGEEIYAPADILANAPAPAGVKILSPFDNLVIQRRRLMNLFDFDYQIECYVPEKKRRFGYFCLPILWNDGLVGRLDAKADRGAQVLELRSMHLDVPAAKRRRFRPDFQSALKSFATFNGCASLSPADF